MSEQSKTELIQEVLADLEEKINYLWVYCPNRRVVWLSEHAKTARARRKNAKRRYNWKA